MAETVSKAEFAALCRVDPSRVSHWIAQGKIKGAAIVGTGRKARINAAEAQRQLSISLDSAQRLGNGLGTRLASAKKAGAQPPAPEPPASPALVTRPAPVGDGLDPDDVGDDALDAELKREKLAALQRTNRRGAEEEAAAQGRYTETAAARRQMTMVAVQAVRTYEGAIPEVATALAARFKLDEREVTLALNELFRGVRDDAAKRAQAAAEKLDRLAPDASGEA